MIDLDKAIYCWDPKTGDATVRAWPMRRHELPGWWTAGAAGVRFDNLDKDGKRMNLLIEAWQSVVRDGVHPLSAHHALLQVEGMSELFAEDCQEVSDGA